MRTQRQFDERYTAPHGGFRDASDYYARASSLPVIARIRVPTLILHAVDDPIVPDDEPRVWRETSQPTTASAPRPRSAAAGQSRAAALVGATGRAAPSGQAPKSAKSSNSTATQIQKPRRVR